MASWDLRQYCDTELSLGRRAPAPGASDLAATELQAMAILGVARRAAAEEEGPTHRPAAGDGGADARLSMRRSLEWFLKQRREASCQRGVAGATSPPSSSCLTD